MSVPVPTASPRAGLHIGVTRWHWWLRGVLVGLLMGAACNTSSYFVRSGGFWGGLLGKSGAFEAIGFPLEMWRMSAMRVDPRAMAVNFSFVVALAMCCGGLTLYLQRPLNRLVAALEQEMRAEGGGRPARQMQFSLRGMLLLTMACGGLAAMVRSASPDSLAAIYLLGPAAMIVMAFLPRGFSLTQRMALLGPLSALLIAAAIVIGWRIGVDLEKVLLGIAVSWTTQSSAAALGLTAIILFLRRRTMFPQHA